MHDTVPRIAARDRGAPSLPGMGRSRYPSPVTQHILVVDDDPDNAELARDILSVGDWRGSPPGAVAPGLHGGDREVG